MLNGFIVDVRLSLFSTVKEGTASAGARKRRYFRAAKFSRIKPRVTFSRGQIFAHLISFSL